MKYKVSSVIDIIDEKFHSDYEQSPQIFLKTRMIDVASFLQVQMKLNDPLPMELVYCLIDFSVIRHMTSVQPLLNHELMNTVMFSMDIWLSIVPGYADPRLTIFFTGLSELLPTLEGTGLTRYTQFNEECKLVLIDYVMRAAGLSAYIVARLANVCRTDNSALTVLRMMNNTWSSPEEMRGATMK